MNYRLKLSVLLCLLIVVLKQESHGQCTQQVFNTSGTAMTGCTSVTVTSDGIAGVLNTYCPATVPYLIGATTISNACANGSYTFTFNPPVSALTLNISGLSNNPTSTEEVRLYVNGSHYAITSAGTADGCDPVAVLTADGNIAPCLNCTLSGWSGTNITGPITTLTVLDTVFMGDPNGSLFSLFICDGHGAAIDLGADTTLCDGDALALNATTQGANAYTWSTGETTPSITVHTTDTYSVSIARGSCTTTDTIHVNFVAAPIAPLSNDTSICTGESVILTARAPDATNYLWSTGATTSEITVTVPGDYQVTASVGSCKAVDTIVVRSQSLLGASLLPDSLAICPGDSVVLDATTPNASTYFWSVNNATSPYITVQDAGSYDVTVSNACGSHIYSTYVDTIDCRTCSIYMPNAFTPNGDGKNDYIGLKTNCRDIKHFLLRIFNRWGEKIFETNNPNEPWDGSYKATPQPSEVYIFYADLVGLEKGIEKTFHLRGSITLIK